MNDKVHGPYDKIADALREIICGLGTLGPGPMPSWVRFEIQPVGETDAEKIAAVDAVAMALLGKPGSVDTMSGGYRHHAADGQVGPVRVSVYRRIEGQERAEIERLRAEVKRLKALNEGLGFSREQDNGDPDAEVAEGIAGTHMTGRPVSGAPAGESFTRYFSFGHGQTDPDTGEGLLNKYVTVIAPTAEGCREAMLASRFGWNWSMEYTPGRRTHDEWIAQWTEHERIVVDTVAATQDGGCE